MGYLLSPAADRPVNPFSVGPFEHGRIQGSHWHIESPPRFEEDHCAQTALLQGDYWDSEREYMHCRGYGPFSTSPRQDYF